MRSTIVRTTLLGAIAVAGAAACPWQAAVAQAPRSAGNANAQMAQQLQQLASERTALQAENGRLKAELDALRKEGDAAKSKQVAGASRRVGELEAAVSRAAAVRESVDKENQQLKAQMQELVGKFRETAQSLAAMETAAATSKDQLATRDQQLRSCRDRNAALFQLNDDVLKRLEGRSVSSSLARIEPFTRLKRIELENMVDEQRSKAEDQQEPPAPAPR